MQTQVEHENPSQKGPRLVMEPITFLLWGDSTDYCTTVLQQEHKLS